MIDSGAKCSLENRRTTSRFYHFLRLMWSEFMLQALLKHCLAMPIHNSDSDSASQPPLHSSSNYQLNSINGESNLFRGNHLVEIIFTAGVDIPAKP
jgi:hypothetical protein